MRGNQTPRDTLLPDAGSVVVIRQTARVTGVPSVPDGPAVDTPERHTTDDGLLDNICGDSVTDVFDVQTLSGPQKRRGNSHLLRVSVQLYTGRRHAFGPGVHGLLARGSDRYSNS